MLPVKHDVLQPRAGGKAKGYAGLLQVIQHGGRALHKVHPLRHLQTEGLVERLLFLGEGRDLCRPRIGDELLAADALVAPAEHPVNHIFIRERRLSRSAEHLPKGGQMHLTVEK